MEMVKRNELIEFERTNVNVLTFKRANPLTCNPQP